MVNHFSAPYLKNNFSLILLFDEFSSLPAFKTKCEQLSAHIN